MRAGALRAEAWVFTGERPIAETENAVPNEVAVPAWNEETFAKEQIRGLVRQVFCPAVSPPVQQVVFSSVDGETDIRSLCSWVGEVLAQEKLAEIAVADESEFCRVGDSALRDSGCCARQRTTPIRRLAVRVHKNVWSFPPQRMIADPSQRSSLCTYMAELRRDFEYSIVAAPSSTTSSKALEMARFADGIILVLSAQRTRRVTAIKVRNALGPVRLLGTVLSDREFPIPTNLYRRL